MDPPPRTINPYTAATASAFAIMQLGWAYDGVNASVPRNTGPECANYLSTQRHWIEGVCAITACLLALRWSYRRAAPLPDVQYPDRPMPFTKKLLLLCIVFTLGLELGFKLAARSVIYILNPCHITTVMLVSGWMAVMRCFGMITLF